MDYGVERQCQEASSPIGRRDNAQPTPRLCPGQPKLSELFRMDHTTLCGFHGKRDEGILDPKRGEERRN